MSQAGKYIPLSGPGAGSVTSITSGTGITLTPNPITDTGSVALTVPVVIANGGTNATSMVNTNGVVYFDGTRLVTAAVGTATQVLTSNGAGVAPTFQNATATGISTINGDTGSVTGTTVTIKGNGATNAGGTIKFSGTGTTLTLNTTDANGNVFVGQGSGNATSVGTSNAAIGRNTLTAIVSGVGNFAACEGALQSLTTGTFNNAFSNIAGNRITTGSFNQLLGFAAGYQYTSSESSNILIGHDNEGTTGESNLMRLAKGTGTGNGEINKTFISGIRGITTVNNDAIAVLIDSAGQLGTVSSSIRYKDNVKEFDSSAVMDLNPVQFNYKNRSASEISYGLIAEDVEKILPQLVVRNEEGLPETIKYQELPIFLLSELKKALKRIEVLESRN